MKTKLTDGIRLYACSMGKVFRVTHVCANDADANEECRKNKDVGCIAVDKNGFVYLAKLYGSIAPSAILDDARD